MEVNFPKHRKVGISFALFFTLGFSVFVVSLTIELRVWSSALLSMMAL